MRNIRRDTVQHKGFLFSFFFWVIVAAVAVAASIVIATYKGRSGERKVAETVLSSAESSVHAVAPPVVEKTIDEIIMENAGMDANLTPAQWKSIRTTCDAWPAMGEQHDGVFRECVNRCHRVSSLSDFVITKFEAFSQQTKDSWRAFSTAEQPSYYVQDKWLDMDHIRPRFVLATLSVREIDSILKARANFQAENDYVRQQSARIDQMIVEFLGKGLTVRDNLYSEPPIPGTTVYLDPKSSLQIYIDTQYRSPSDGPRIGLKVPPQDLPPCDVTRELLVHQLLQPPLSTGATSSDRAAK